MTTLYALALLLAQSPPVALSLPAGQQLGPPEQGAQCAPGPGGAVQAGSVGGPDWSYVLGMGQAELALGDGGSLLLAETTGGSAWLFSAYEAADPPLPVWTAGGDFSMDVPAAADGTDLFLGLELEIVSTFTSVGHLRAYRSASGTPLWDVPFAEQFFSTPAFDVSRDGSVVVSVFLNDTTQGLELRVHDPATGVVLREFLYRPSVLPWGRMCLSPDGSLLALSGTSGLGVTAVVDLATGERLFSTDGSLPAEQGLSRRGGVLVVLHKVPAVGWHLKAFERHGATDWQLALDIATPLQEVPQDAAVSDDGSIVGAGWKLPAAGAVALAAYDVAARTQGFQQVLNGSPLLDNYVEDVALSSDGRRFAAGLWGSGGMSELQVLDPLGGALISSFPLGGSVFALDLSADGRHLAANRAPNHASQGHQFTRVEMYTVGDQDLALSGTPGAGQSIDVALQGPAGGLAYLLGSLALAEPPLPFGQAGTLLLDPSSLIVLPFGSYDGNGSAAGTLQLPSAPSLVGTAYHLQAAGMQPPHLGTTTLKLRLLP